MRLRAWFLATLAVLALAFAAFSYSGALMNGSFSVAQQSEQYRTLAERWAWVAAASLASSFALALFSWRLFRRSQAKLRGPPATRDGR